MNYWFYITVWRHCTCNYYMSRVVTVLYSSDSINTICGDDLPMTAVLNCTEGVIDLTFASWGRSHTTECRGPPGTNDNTQCQYSISDLFSACHGVTSCVVPDVQGSHADPCDGTTKYIQVLYFCVSGKARFHRMMVTHLSVAPFTNMV